MKKIIYLTVIFMWPLETSETAREESIREQISRLRGQVGVQGGPRPVTDEELAQTRQYIDDMRYNGSVDSDLEGVFFDWEALVGKRNEQRMGIQRQTQDKISMEEEKQKIKEALADLSPDNIETSFRLIEALLQMVPEQYRVLLAGYAGSLVLEKFEKHNQHIVLGEDNMIEVTPTNRARATPELLQNNIDLVLRMNSLIQSGRLDINILRTGMLYRADSFASYSKSVSGADGKVMNPEEVKYSEKYLQYLQTKKDSGLPLSPAEETVMASDGSIRQYPLMIPAIEQFRDFEKLSHNAEIVAKTAQQQVMPTGDSSGASDGKASGNGASSGGGDGLGSDMAGLAGKLAGAASNGVANSFSKALAVAGKEGGPGGQLVLLGALIYGWCKLGFFKGIIAALGFGAVTEGMSGRLDEKGKTQEKKLTVPEKPSKQTAKVLATPEKVKNTPSTDGNYTNFLATAGFSVDTIQESKETLSKFDNVKYSEVEAFAREGKPSPRIDAILGDKNKPEYNQRKEILKKYVNALVAQDAEGGGFGNAMDDIRKNPQYNTWTMKQIREYIFNIKERAKEASNTAEGLAQQAASPEDAVALREVASGAREAAEKGDVEGVYWYSGIISEVKDTGSYVKDNGWMLASIGFTAYWLNKKLGIVKGGKWVWGKGVGAGKWVGGKFSGAGKGTISPEGMKTGAEGTGKAKWVNGKYVSDGEPKATTEKVKAETPPVEKVPPTTSDTKNSPETPKTSGTLNIDRSILETKGLTTAEKEALESVIQKTEELHTLEAKAGQVPVSEMFQGIEKREKLAQEIQQEFSKLVTESPELISKLEAAGEQGSKIATEIKTLAKTASKIEAGELIAKVLKVFKKV